MDKAGKGRRMSSRIAKAQHFRAAGTFTAGICQKKKEQTGHTLPNKFSNTLRLTLFIQEVGKESYRRKALVALFQPKGGNWLRT